ncbi:Metallo-dependent phosphatase-like protein [Powellomyces hirtus]|nr:Metallo-dependent phosphatase-like protein [Powellomyces hirtus]
MPVLKAAVRLFMRNPFALIWVLNLFACEFLLARRYIGACSWPILTQFRRNDFHIAVLTDPQLTDAYSYGQSGLSLKLTQFYSDLYMKRNFKVLESKLRPDAFWVLGDIMDGAREWESTRARNFEPELARVRKVFKLQNPSTPFFWAPGNHDIGYGDRVVPSAYDRFRTVFGEPNYMVDIGNNTLVVLDTVSLSGHPGAAHYDNARNFLDTVAKTPVTSPRILISHIPLYRPDNSDCGKLRKSKRSINQGRGYQYQNLVVEGLSREILDAVKPSLILSGDDHDWCEQIHTLGNGHSSVEQTVATFSWMQGNHFPGFGLLTLRPANVPGTTDATFKFAACHLPPQLRIYFWYIALLLITLLALIPWINYQRSRDARSYVEIPLFTYNQLRGGQYLRRTPKRRRGNPAWANSRFGHCCASILYWYSELDSRTWHSALRILGETAGIGVVWYLVLIAWDWMG